GEVGAWCRRLKPARKQRNQIKESERKTAELLGHREHAAGRLTGLDEALDQARQTRTRLQGQIADDEGKRRSVEAEFRRVTALVEKLKEYERQENDLARLEEELKRMAADPPAAARQAREAHDALAALSQVLPLLARLHGLREDLRQATARAKAADEARQAIQQKGEQLKADVGRLGPLLEEAT